MIKRFMLMVILAGCGSAPPTIIYQEVPVEVPAEGTGLMVVDADGQEVGHLIGINDLDTDRWRVLAEPYLFWVHARTGEVISQYLETGYWADPECSVPSKNVRCTSGQFKQVWSEFGSAELYELEVTEAPLFTAGCFDVSDECVAEPVPLQLDMDWAVPLEVQ